MWSIQTPHWVLTAWSRLGKTKTNSCVLLLFFHEDFKILKNADLCNPCGGFSFNNLKKRHSYMEHCSSYWALIERTSFIKNVSVQHQITSHQPVIFKRKSFLRTTTVGPHIGDWNRKHKKSKTISSRVDVFKNLTEMDIFCFKSAAIIVVYQILHLIDEICLEIVKILS